MKSTRLSFGLIAFLTTGCVVTPKPVVRLKYAGSPSTRVMRQGVEVIERENSTLKWQVAFDEGQDGRIVFNLAITNKTSKVRRVTPNQFTYYPAKDGAWTRNAVATIDPESEIVEAQLAQSSQTAAEQSRSGTSLFFSVTGAALSIAESDPEKRAEISREQRLHASGDARYEANAMSTSAKLAHREHMWRFKTLRETDLMPGESVVGKIVFPLNTQTNAILLCHRGPPKACVPYTQIVISPER